MSASSLTIRPASWNDRAAIAALVEGMGGHDGATALGSWTSALGAALQSPDSRVLVAERGRGVIGVAHLEARPSLVNGGREGWLGALAVAAPERGSGVGRALVDAIDREAVLLGCEAIALESTHWRNDAHRVYRTIGFVEQPPARRFRRPVHTDADGLVDRFFATAARAAAAVAGLLAQGGDVDVATGADGLPTKAIDRTAEAAAVAVLLELCLPIVSEEAGTIGRHPAGDEPWLALDPLDGTRNFTRGHPPWAIAIGLVERGAARAGYVVDLSSGRRWWGGPGAGALVDGRPATPSPGGLLVVPGLTDDSAPPRLPAGFDRLRMAGATTVELCRVADGAAGAFVDLDRGVVRVHDLAGPMAVLLGAGCTVVGRDGSVPVLEPDPGRPFHVIAAAPTTDVAALAAHSVPVGSP